MSAPSAFLQPSPRGSQGKGGWGGREKNPVFFMGSPSETSMHTIHQIFALKNQNTILGFLQGQVEHTFGDISPERANKANCQM